MRNAHRWNAAAGKWVCEADCSVRICGDEMATQYSSAGFIVLRELLPPGVIDEMSASVNKYIASRGPLVRAYDSGYLLPGIDRDPALGHLFEWVHRNPKVHAHSIASGTGATVLITAAVATSL